MLMEREIYTPVDTEVFFSDLVTILLDSAVLFIHHPGFNPYSVWAELEMSKNYSLKKDDLVKSGSRKYA